MRIFKLRLPDSVYTVEMSTRSQKGGRAIQCHSFFSHGEFSSRSNRQKKASLKKLKVGLQIAVWFKWTSLYCNHNCLLYRHDTISIQGRISVESTYSHGLRAITLHLRYTSYLHSLELINWMQCSFAHMICNYKVNYCFSRNGKVTRIIL